MFLFIFLLTVVKAAGPLCFNCSGSQTANCMAMIRCEDDEICYTQKYVSKSGDFRFRSGCEKKSICNGLSKRSRPTVGDPIVCESCCDGDRCTSYRCGSRPYPYHGTVCYSCPTLADPRDCKHAQYCAHGEKCLAFKYRMPLSNQVMFSVGCATQLQCASLEQATTESHRFKEARYNQTCCDRELCNDGRVQIANMASSNSNNPHL